LLKLRDRIQDKIEAAIAGLTETARQSLAPLAGLLIGASANVAGIDPVTASLFAAAGLGGLLRFDSALAHQARDRRLQNLEEEAAGLDQVREDLVEAVEYLVRFARDQSARVGTLEHVIHDLKRVLEEHIQEPPPSKAGDLSSAVRESTKAITVHVRPERPPVAHSEIAEGPEYFCERPYLKERILQAVESSYEEGGYVIIRGGPGTGKSALIWHLERFFRGKNDGPSVPCFYIRRGQSEWDQPDVILRALLHHMMDEVPPD
ncbi:unnamed protein product, partial [marine sediment metagenome]